MNTTAVPALSLTQALRDEVRRIGSLTRTGQRRHVSSNGELQETSDAMTAGPSNDPHLSECLSEPPALAGTGGSSWATAASERVDAKSRLARLAQTLESDVIPRLVGAHGIAPRRAEPFEAREIAGFVDLLRDADDAQLQRAVEILHQRGLSVESIFLQLFAPAARHLNDLWVADRCDFSTVTVCLGRLQALLRFWSPAFGAEVEHPPNSRRILLAQHPDEQHIFGLSMVAEFFRREGWEVLGGVGGAVPDPSAQVSKEWFDAVGFSVGSQTRLEWLRGRIAKLRTSSRNRSIVVLAGGPIFMGQSELAQWAGADASGHEGDSAPALAEQLLASRHARR